MVLECEHKNKYINWECNKIKMTIIIETNQNYVYIHNISMSYLHIQLEQNYHQICIMSNFEGNNCTRIFNTRVVHEH